MSDEELVIRPILAKEIERLKIFQEDCKEGDKAWNHFQAKIEIIEDFLKKHFGVREWQGYGKLDYEKEELRQEVKKEKERENNERSKSRV